MAKAQKMTTCFLFQGKAEEAARFYVKTFKKNSKILSVNPHVTMFQLEGQTFMALNGPEAPPNWAVSQMVLCKTQKEIDRLWKALGDGGKEQQCGWITDKYGFSWQIVPEVLSKLMSDKNKTKADRTFQAMIKMVKLDIATLKKAHAGK